MKRDPYPNTADYLLEERFRELFREEVSVNEPEKVGVWLDPVSKKLKIKYAGKIYSVVMEST